MQWFHTRINYKMLATTSFFVKSFLQMVQNVPSVSKQMKQLNTSFRNASVFKRFYMVISWLHDHRIHLDHEEKSFLSGIFKNQEMMLINLL